jgi:DNA-directed RNA polymerase subunit RPC12/RpoP
MVLHWERLALDANNYGFRVLMIWVEDVIVGSFHVAMIWLCVVVSWLYAVHHANICSITRSNPNITPTNTSHYNPQPPPTLPAACNKVNELDQKTEKISCRSCGFSILYKRRTAKRKLYPPHTPHSKP